MEIANSSTSIIERMEKAAERFKQLEKEWEYKAAILEVKRNQRDGVEVEKKKRKTIRSSSEFSIELLAMMEDLGMNLDEGGNREALSILCRNAIGMQPIYKNNDDVGFLLNMEVK